MAVINITITESPIQLIAGIPKNILLTTSIPATVFYTMDGTDPDFNSNIAVGPIELPTNQGSIFFKYFASDGFDTCPIVEIVYGPNFSSNRRPRSKVIGLDGPRGGTNPPQFGASVPNPHVTYGNTAGITVDSPDVDGPSDGYDGTATGTSAVNPDLPYVRSNYSIKYSSQNSLGESGPNIGNLPANVTIVVPKQVTNSNDANSKLFNPRSLVIIQDGREESEDPNVNFVNRQFFSLGNPEKIRDGIGHHTTGLEGSVATGAMVRRDYNPKTRTWTFSYRDSETNRWIFSIEPINESLNINSINQVALPSSGLRSRKVFQWIPFKRSHLR